MSFTCSKCKGSKKAKASKCGAPCPGASIASGPPAAPPPVPVSEPLDHILARLKPLKPESHVALLNFSGLFAPITKGQIACITQARDILLGNKEPMVPVPGFRPFAECLVYVRLDSPDYVISVEDRKRLVHLATTDVDWLIVA